MNWLRCKEYRHTCSQKPSNTQDAPSVGYQLADGLDEGLRPQTVKR
jgi:hypothetical protein